EAVGAARAPEALPPPTAPYRPLPLLPPLLLAISAFALLRMPETLIILRSQELGVPIAVVPLLWAAVHVVKSSSSFAGGAWSDRLGARRTMWLGWVSYALLAGGMAAAQTSVQAWALFLALGLVAGLTESPERALVAQLAGGRQGSGFGVYHGATGLAALVGGVALGALYQQGSAALAFGVSAAGGAVLALGWPLLAVARERRGRS
ncbi:MAG TPA: MFS transporter, partial [Gemmatimonadales bacterium]|nr:MFS transporter [Gemmatimonadales bacterium]